MATQCDNLEPDFRNTTQPRTIVDEQARVSRLWMPLLVLELELWRCELPLLLW